jgi:hypothetical protein
MLFSEDIFMTFGHPTIPTAFGSLTRPDLKMMKRVHEVTNFENEIKTKMTEEERALLSDRQLQMYRDHMQKVKEWQSQFEQDMYADQDQVLDTDFNTFVVFYGCQENIDEINNNG